MLQAKLCVEGRHALYSYCEENGVPFKKVGKLIVATHANQVPVLENLMRAGEANGVTDLRLMEASEAKELEPHVHCVKALWSPSSGILDTHSFMLTLQVRVCTNNELSPFMCNIIITSLLSTELRVIRETRYH